MYTTGVVLGATTTGAAVAAAVLPNTGVGTSLVAVAVASLVGLLIWGAVYTRTNK